MAYHTPNVSPLVSQIEALPVVQQIEIIQQIVAGEDFTDLTFVLVRALEEHLEALHRDAVDQASDENNRLHGPEVSSLVAPWVSPCGVRVGL